MDAPATDPRDAQLLEQLGWVRRLALAQVRDRHAADDLAQEVARVRLEKRPLLTGGPRSWLAAVLRKLAIDRARSDASRKAREQSAAPVDTRDGAFEVVERGARQRCVFDAVLELPEPYRSTILYRYFDDLGTRDVALRTGVPEATVRKRVERGLALLRARLDREFGARTDTWALALLEPGMRDAVLQAGLWKGTALMSTKWFAAAAAAVLLAGAAWYVHEIGSGETDEAIGGTGVVVPAEVATARERERGPDVPAETNRSARTLVPAAAPAHASAPGLHGYVFVDDVHSAPEGLEIQRRVDGDYPTRVAIPVDVARASWSIDVHGEKPGYLWITSAATVPARIPIPPDLWSAGGEFDLHLVTGRTLVLTIMHADTRRPLAGLEFELSRSVVVERGGGRVVSDGNQTLHTTDAQGRARITGLPIEGHLSVTVDATERERDVAMRDGPLLRMRVPREPDWRSWLKKEQPAVIEQTIAVRPPLGEACAGGSVPAWAIAAAGGADGLRVIARETTNETPQARGMTFVLPVDARGRFELCSNAPSTHLVWLEKIADRARISAESTVKFDAPGAQEDIVFRQFDGRAVTLRFVRVPEHGTLQARLVGQSSLATAGAWPCRGEDFAREVTVGDGEHIQLMLRMGSEADPKSGLTRIVPVGDERQITIDLGGSERALRLDFGEIGAPVGDGSIVLLRVEDGEATVGQSIVALCSAGRSLATVHVPDGRWVYRYEDAEQVAVWGVVDVAAATRSGEELLLRPRLRHAAPGELEPGLRFDEIEGVGLSNLPEKARVTSAKGVCARTLLPSNAKFAALDGKH